MNYAVQNTSYEGRFVFLADDELHSLYLVHKVHDGEEKERLVALDGPSTEIIRDSQAVVAMTQGNELIQVGSRARLNFAPLKVPSAEHLDLSYSFAVLKGSRVAGRDTVEIVIKPKDKYRYGYELFLCKKSGLPLRSKLISENGEVISQVMFVQLRVGKNTMQVDHDISSLSHARGLTLPSYRDLKIEDSQWRFSDVPSGYLLSMHRTSSEERKVEHFVFSDGLSSVSVYVEDTDEYPQSEYAKLAGMQAFSKRRHDHLVTAVGEAPLSTLQKFVQGITANQ